MIDNEKYRSEYNKGWRYAAKPTATLDHLDAINASQAMYDGYHDYAADRPKWSSAPNRKRPK